MSATKFATAAGVIFGAVALAHLLRGIFNWEIVVEGRLIPEWISWLAVVVAGSLSQWGFRIAGCCSRRDEEKGS